MPQGDSSHRGGVRSQQAPRADKSAAAQPWPPQPGEPSGPRDALTAPHHRPNPGPPAPAGWDCLLRWWRPLSPGRAPCRAPNYTLALLRKFRPRPARLDAPRGAVRITCRAGHGHPGDAELYCTGPPTPPLTAAILDTTSADRTAGRARGQTSAHWPSWGGM